MMEQAHVVAESVVSAVPVDKPSVNELFSSLVPVLVVGYGLSCCKSYSCNMSVGLEFLVSESFISSLHLGRNTETYDEAVSLNSSPPSSFGNTETPLPNVRTTLIRFRTSAGNWQSLDCPAVLSGSFLEGLPERHDELPEQFEAVLYFQKIMVGGETLAAYALAFGALAFEIECLTR